jgi:HEPN domain-containing protein
MILGGSNKMNQNRYEAIRWFSQAEKDLKATQISSSGNSYEWACFQSQQSAEKTIKTLLILTGRRRTINHSLFELLLEASKNHPVLMELKRLVKPA